MIEISHHQLDVRAFEIRRFGRIAHERAHGLAGNGELPHQFLSVVSVAPVISIIIASRLFVGLNRDSPFSFLPTSRAGLFLIFFLLHRLASPVSVFSSSPFRWGERTREPFFSFRLSAFVARPIPRPRGPSTRLGQNDRDPADTSSQPRFFFFFSSSFPLSLLATCFWFSVLVCPAALWLALEAEEEVARVPAPPLTEVLSTVAVRFPPPEVFTPPMATMVPEIVPPDDRVALPPERTVPAKLWAALMSAFCWEIIRPVILPVALAFTFTPITPELPRIMSPM